MDPIAILESRIEQLESKLGFAVNAVTETQNESVTNNLLNAFQSVTNATMGQEKLSEGMRLALELNKYTDPNFVEINEQCNKNKFEIAASESVLRRYCEYILRCKQAEPILESEAIKGVPKMQESVDQLLSSATQVKSEADAVSQGIQEVAETCGSAAAATSEQLAAVAQQVQITEQKLFPQQRNEYD